MNLEKINEFAKLVEEQQFARMREQGLSEAIINQYKVRAVIGKKYIKVDIGTSGKFMIDESGNIFGIKAYGVINKKKQYGTLDTIDQYFWGDYNPQRIANSNENPNSFNYQMLGRLKSDCEYYLGFGNRSKNNLYYKDEQEHINNMKELYNSFLDDEKPEWLTYEQILSYEKLMILN